MERKRFLADQEKLEHEMKSIAIEKEKLEQIAVQVRQRSKDIEDMCMVSLLRRGNFPSMPVHVIRLQIQ